MKTLVAIALVNGLALLYVGITSTDFAMAAAPAQRQQKTLSDVLTILTEKKYDPVVEISFDDGVWEAEVYKGDIAFEVTIDPDTGEVIHEHRDDGDPKPPAGSMPLTKIVVALEKAGYTNIDDISFERRSWEVEATRENQKRELRVDPKDGRVISDRVDD